MGDDRGTLEHAADAAIAGRRKLDRPPHGRCDQPVPGDDMLDLDDDEGTYAAELLAHLTGLPSAEAEIQLDITVRVPGGVPDNVVRTVTENARTLNFTSADFDVD